MRDGRRRCEDGVMAVAAKSTVAESRYARFNDGRRKSFVSSNTGAERGEGEVPFGCACEFVGTSSDGRRVLRRSAGRAGGVSGL